MSLYILQISSLDSMYVISDGLTTSYPSLTGMQIKLLCVAIAFNGNAYFHTNSVKKYDFSIPHQTLTNDGSTPQNNIRLKHS